MGRLLDFEDRERAHRLPLREFKDIYLYAHEQGLKGCTTFRFNPEAFQGVLVKEAGPQEHHLHVHARGRHGGRGARR